MIDSNPFIGEINALLRAGGLRPVDDTEREIIDQALVGTVFRWNCDVMTDSCWAAVDAFMATRGVIFKQMYLGGANCRRVVEEAEE